MCRVGPTLRWLFAHGGHHPQLPSPGAATGRARVARGRAPRALECAARRRAFVAACLRTRASRTDFLRASFERVAVCREVTASDGVEAPAGALVPSESSLADMVLEALGTMRCEAESAGSGIRDAFRRSSGESGSNVAGSSLRGVVRVRGAGACGAAERRSECVASCVNGDATWRATTAYDTRHRRVTPIIARARQTFGGLSIAMGMTSSWHSSSADAGGELSTGRNEVAVGRCVNSSSDGAESLTLGELVPGCRDGSLEWGSACAAIVVVGGVPSRADGVVRRGRGGGEVRRACGGGARNAAVMPVFGSLPGRVGSSSASS